MPNAKKRPSFSELVDAFSNKSERVLKNNSIHSLNLSENLRIKHPIKGKGVIVAVKESHVEVKWTGMGKSVLGVEKLGYKDAKYLKPIAQKNEFNFGSFMKEEYSDEDEDAEVEMDDEKENKKNKKKGKKEVKESVNTLTKGSVAIYDNKEVIVIGPGPETMIEIFVKDMNESIVVPPSKLSFKARTNLNEAWLSTIPGTYIGGSTKNKIIFDDEMSFDEIQLIENGTMLAPSPSDTILSSSNSTKQNVISLASIDGDGGSGGSNTGGSQDMTNCPVDAPSDPVVKTLGGSNNSSNSNNKSSGNNSSNSKSSSSKSSKSSSSKSSNSKSSSGKSSKSSGKMKKTNSNVSKNHETDANETTGSDETGDKGGFSFAKNRKKDKNDETMEEFNLSAHDIGLIVEMDNSKNHRNMNNDEQMYEHKMGGNELGLTVDMAVEIFKAVLKHQPNDDQLKAIANGLANCCDGEDRSLDVKDINKAMQSIKDAYNSNSADDGFEPDDDTDVGDEFEPDDDGNDDSEFEPDNDGEFEPDDDGDGDGEFEPDDDGDDGDDDDDEFEDKADGDGEPAGSEAGDEHKGKTKLMSGLGEELEESMTQDELDDMRRLLGYKTRRLIG